MAQILASLVLYGAKRYKMIMCVWPQQAERKRGGTIHLESPACAVRTAGLTRAFRAMFGEKLFLRTMYAFFHKHDSEQKSRIHISNGTVREAFCGNGVSRLLKFDRRAQHARREGDDSA